MADDASTALRATNEEPDVTDDAFLGGALHVLQPKDGLRAGLDAVFLAAAAPATGGQSVLDAGAGVGVVGLAVARRCPGARVTCVEIEPRLASLARRNAERNGLADRVSVIEADLTLPFARLDASGLARESYDHVLANPPFFEPHRVRRPAAALRERAGTLGPGGLDRWVRFLAAMAKPGGTATLVHRADALPEVLSALQGRFGGLRVLPLYPRQGEPASRIIVQGIKGSRAPLHLLPGFDLHADDGSFLPAAQAILRQGAPLPWPAAGMP